MAHKLPDTTILLLNVENRALIDCSDTASLYDDDREFGAYLSGKVLRSAALRCERAKVEFEARAGFGPVPETIAEVARQVKIDQIVMGTHGRGRLGTAVLGSVANGVIRLVHVPVTLIKAGERHWEHRQGGGLAK